MDDDKAALSALVDMATADPVEARRRADELLSGDAEDDPYVHAYALWARGLAAREQLDLDRALADLGKSSDLLSGVGDEQTAAKVRSSLAVVHIRRGEFDVAIHLVDEAEQWLDGLAAARNKMQRGLALQRLGETQSALRAYEEALPGLKNEGDLIPAAGMLSNMGVLLAYEGLFERSIGCLHEAMALAEESGQELLQAMTLHNLAFALGRQGSLVTALEHFDRAIDLHQGLGLPPERLAFVNLDRAEVLAGAGLIGEARASVDDALSRLTDAGSDVDVAEAQLLAARLALIAADHKTAQQRARLASEAFERQGRGSWHLLAQLIELVGTDDRSQISQSDVEGLANRLEERGWDAESRQARLYAARTALAKGDLTVAEAILLEVSGTAERATAMELAEAAHARSLLAMAKGEDELARQAVRSGLNVLDDYRSTLGSVELRAHGAVLGRELIELGLRLALETGDPWQVLDTVEAWRAASLRTAPPKLPDDPTLHQAMARLRSLDAEIHDETCDVEDLRVERVVLESKIQHRMRRASPGGSVQAALEMSPAQLDRERGSRGIVSFFRNGDQLSSVMMSDQGIRQRDLASMDDVSRLTSGITFSLRRLARAMGPRSGHTSAASGAAAVAALDQDANELYERLLPGAEGTGGLVIVPTGVLHRLPWTAIARGHPVVVTPSLRAWLGASQRRMHLSSTSATALIAGPGLPGAKREVERLARKYPNRVRLTGRNATADRVIEALEWCTIAHVAAHGSFRADNPLFSSLLLADGQLSVYEIDRLQRPPSVVVLPSCDAAVTEVLTGDEVLGFASALMHLGVSTVVAPVVPIPDEATTSLMIDLHRRLRSGEHADAALAAIAATKDLSDAQTAAVNAFVVIGS